MDTNGNARVSVPRALGYVAMWTDQPEQLRDLFVTSLRFEVAYEDASVVVFQMEGDTDLVIQRVDSETQHLNGRTQIGFYVEDIAKLTDTLKEREVPLSLEMSDVGDEQFITIISAPTGHQVELVGGAELELPEEGWDDLDET